MTYQSITLTEFEIGGCDPHVENLRASNAFALAVSILSVDERVEAPQA